ncbi:MAG: O-antigen ligase family protein [Novosphingobium sp.]
MRSLLRPRTTELRRRTSGIQGARGDGAPGSAIGLPQIELATAAVALVAISATAIFGTVAAFLFIGASVLLAALRPAESVRDLARFWPLLALPLLAALSTIWSDAPARTLRASIQLFLTIASTIFVCRRIPARQTLLILAGAFLFMCLLAVPAIPAAVAKNVPLVGPFGSKNAMGFAAHALFALALAVGCDRTQPTAARIAAPFAVAYAFLVASLAHSAGTEASFAITLLTFPAFLIFGKVSFRARIALLVGVGLAVALGIAFLPDIQQAWDTFRTDVLKKDSTLTGRTYLWDFAARLTAQRPWLGHGYYAFWRHGNIDAEGLWQWGGIASRTGFNFHNAFIEMNVDLGLVGVALLFIVCATIALSALYCQLHEPSVTMAFLLSFLCILYIRTYSESTLLAPFNTITVLWMAAGVYAMARQQRSTPSPRGNAISRARRAI